MKTFAMLMLPAALCLVLGVTGCNGCASTAAAPVVSSDPADVNMLPATGQAGQTATVVQPARVLDERQNGPQTYQQGEQYPVQQGGSPQQGSSQPPDALDEADQAPPPLPQYSEPAPTQPNTLWTPGYWRNSRNGYYWVPGAWVAPPYAGALWTPGYWGADGSRFRFHQGYWGRHVGFYGGVPYGGGYTGTGYRGGYWNGNDFRYNQAVYHVDVNLFHNVYNQPERMDYPYGRVSFNGGQGGIPVVPIAAEMLALHEQHVGAVRFQYDIDRQAYSNRAQFYQNNHGRPEAYFAGNGYVRPGEVVVQRQVVVEGHDGFPGRGHAYGHDDNRGEHHDDHHDDGRGRGDAKHDH